MLDFIEWGYDLVSWPGIVLFMAIESAAIPLPSELIMPFAGWFLIEDKGLGPEWLLLAGFCGALGNLLGSLVAYAVSAWKGRPFLERYGKYILISKHDLDRADSLFARYGDQIVFFSRLLPVVRTFISVPAGIVRMPLLRFSVLTFAGAFLWSMALAGGGYALGENYEELRAWMRPVDIPIVATLLIAIGWYVYSHVKRSWRPEEIEAEPGV
jgi:membrane protein DedA with SNARE-associated domain